MKDDKKQKIIDRFTMLEKVIPALTAGFDYKDKPEVYRRIAKFALFHAEAIETDLAEVKARSVSENHPNHDA
jgi:hypothetical protein